MRNWKWWILGVIVVLGAILRLVWLDKYPLGFTPDEAAFGYNAYSLLKTGHDEWGIPFWQLPYKNLRSFGDYKMPLYAFLTVPSVAFFGLNEISTRLPNALLGTLAVIVIYILVKKMFPKSKTTAQYSALLIAISPWAIPLSRGAFEANLITLFLPLATCFYINKNYKLSIISFSLCLYTYHSARMIVPFALLGMFIFIRQKIKKPFYLILLLLLFIPAVYSFLFSNARATDVSIFHPDDNWEAMSQTRLHLIQSGWPEQISRLAANKVTFTGIIFLRHYISYFSFGYLFDHGPAEATYGMLPGIGTLYLIQLPFLLVFIYRLLKTKNKNHYLLLLLLLVSPIPAALAKGPGFAANRSAFMVIPLTVMTALGMGFIIQKISKFNSFLLLLILLLPFGKFILDYILLSPNVSAHVMGYGFNKIEPFIQSQPIIYDEIRISRSLSEPHIYLAFFGRFDPKSYQIASQKWLEFEKRGYHFLDQLDGYTLGKYRFGDLNYLSNESGLTLYIGHTYDFPPDISLSKIAIYPDNKSAIVSDSR